MERQPARLYQKAVHQVHRIKQLSKRLRGSSICYQSSICYEYKFEPCTPKQIWDKLKERFERNTVANKLFLKQKLFSLKMKDCDSLDDHLRRMKEITDQLAAIKAPIPEDEYIVALLYSAFHDYITL
jgi:hypothetical protein